VAALALAVAAAQANAATQAHTVVQANVSGHAGAVAQASASATAECARIGVPKSGQPGKDVAWIPTAEPLVGRMLRLANVKPTDVVYDLGAGDGRIVIAAAKLGAKAVGVEDNPKLVQLARCLIGAEGLSSRARIIQGDLLQTSIDDATVVTLFLTPELDARLFPKLLALKPGTRIVSHAYLLRNWPPDQRIITPDGMAYLWVVPAHVDGSWVFHGRRGRDRFTVDFIQVYQQLRGIGDNGSVLTDTRLAGTHVAFDFPDGSDLAHVTGEVEGSHILATVTRDGRTSDYVGTRS
jgi:SAM-dependent methyltransferase